MEKWYYGEFGKTLRIVDLTVSELFVFRHIADDFFSVSAFSETFRRIVGEKRSRSSEKMSLLSEFSFAYLLVWIFLVN